MKTTGIITSIAAALGLAATASANHCIAGEHSAGITTYNVIAQGVPDIPGICGGLWDNLNHFPWCVVSAPSCGANDIGELEWRFTVPSGCDGGSVESAWWEATRNQWGAISC